MRPIRNDLFTVGIPIENTKGRRGDCERNERRNRF